MVNPARPAIRTHIEGSHAPGLGRTTDTAAGRRESGNRRGDVVIHARLARETREPASGSEKGGRKPSISVP